MRSVRPVVRTLIAVLLAGCCAVLVATTAAASDQRIRQQSAGTSLADSHTLTLSIDSVSPQYATSTKTVTVSGTLSNHTGSAIPGIAVQLQSYPSAFATRSDMASYVNGGPVALQAGTAVLQPEGTPDQLSGSLANGATAHWTVSFSPGPDYYSEFGVSPGFGVYPLQVQATSTASSHQAAARTLLPYWPGSGAAEQLQVAWIWPLIDTPQQGACPQDLATSSLAGSLAAGGRLSTLLGTGAQWAARDELTWAIDPALLSDVAVMTHPYLTEGNSTCTGRTVHQASAAATSWLSEVQADTDGAPAFATPYADVDVSALSHAGLDASLRSAYQVGDATASQLLPDTFGANGSGGKDGLALAAAWPAGGTADAGVLTSLASDGGIKTVVLSSNELSTSAPDYDDALARTRTGGGASMSVLLADSGITGILGSTSAASSAPAQFAVTQDFLAQTAMILAEAPNLRRSLVVAPPTGWDPSAAEATDLLQLTMDAPWLRATGLGTLAAQAAKVPARKLRTRQVSKAELSDLYVDQLQSLSTSVSTFENLLYRPQQAYLSSLAAATAVTESAAWRGRGSPGGWLALTKLSDFVANQEGQVKIIASRKVLLAGTSGTTPVSVTNGLGMPVQVLVEASTPAGSTLRVGSGSGSFERPLTVNPHMTQTVRMPMNSSSIGTTIMRLQLLTSNGSPLTGPTASASMSVEVTRFGRTLLVIIVAALGVLLLTSIVRLRRKRRAGGRHGGDRDYDKAEARAHAGGAG
jgi:hypothetical protein